MTELLVNQVVLLVADLMVLVPAMLGLYILVLNPRQRANQAAAGYILLLAGINFFVVLILRNPAEGVLNAALRAYVALVPANGPATLFILLYLLYPSWLRGRHRPWRYVLWGLIFLPAVLVGMDTLFGTRLLYTAPQVFIPGQIPSLRVLAGGAFGVLVRTVLSTLANIAAIAIIPYLMWRAPLTRQQRTLGWWLLITQVIALLLFTIGRQFLQPSFITLVLGSTYATAGAAAAYQQRLLGGGKRYIRLQPRLTSLLLTLILPVLVFLTVTANGLVHTLTRTNADARLHDTASLVANEVQQWLDFNAEALRNMAQQPEIVSMDPALQEPILRSMDASHNYMYLVSTTDVLGHNVARSDGAAPKDYGDRLWVQKALRGESPVLQVLIGRTSHQPALVMSTPIRNRQNNIVGVAMFASTLSDLSNTVLQARVGESGFAYLVDEHDLLIAHPKMSGALLTELENYSGASPISALRTANAPNIYTTYTDTDGITWRAYATALPNGWAVVMQQPVEEYLGVARLFTNLSIALVVLITGILLLLIWVTVRQVVAPVEHLTATAQRIAAGDLELRVPDADQDEIGALGRVLNQVTARLRDAIQELETRIAERTLALERRTAQLQAAAEVGNAIGTIRDLDTLLPQVTQLISQHFGFYHVGIFLLDDRGEYAVLQAANSEGGQRMLARKHRLRVGTQGIVGFSAFTRRPRIALNVGEDAVHFNNPDLPDTQSEMALPLIVGDELIGVLDVQSTQPNAFEEEDVETLTVLARQVATAIQNARLVEETRRLLEAQEEAAGLQSRRAWRRQVETLIHPVVRRTPAGLEHPQETASSEVPSRVEPTQDPEDPHLLYVPLRIGGVFIGHLQARKPADGPAWSAREIAFMRTLSDELGPALESARLYQETQISAQQQRIAVDVATRLRQNLDLESILRTAVHQVQQSLGLPEVAIQLGGLSDDEAS